MLNPSSPPNLIPALRQDDRDVRAKLAKGLNRMNAGVSAPAPVYADILTPQAAQLLYSARLALTVTQALSGTPTIDGVPSVANDIVLVAQNLTTDGLYTVSSPTWTPIILCKDMPLGSQVNVYAGNTSPLTWDVWKNPVGTTNQFIPQQSGLAQYSVLTLGVDILTARIFTSSTVADASRTFNIMLPWTLRKSPFDGLTVNGVHYVYTANNKRTATQGATTETQLITQDYFVGSIIYASPLRYPIVVSGTTVTLIDKNLDGRAWAKQ